MRQLWAENRAVLRSHRSVPSQVDREDAEAHLPPYLESFLAHLRMLVGVPFRYLVPDERLLPKESIRFFYLDRSWTDRLVDGAMAVGKIGTRELALHHGHAPSIRTTLDVAQRVVRRLQRGRVPTEYRKLVDEHKASHDEERPITGFLLRSALVSGWPHMDVRGYDWPEGAEPPPIGFHPGDNLGRVRALEPLRIERLSPSVMVALFDGEPKLVTLEEPHNGVQFGIRDPDVRPNVPLRGSDGRLVDGTDPNVSTDVPFRDNSRNVVDVMKLRDRLHADQATHSVPLPQRIEQSGAANFALAVLNAPDRQRFEGTEDERRSPRPPRPGGGIVVVSGWVADPPLRARVEEVLTDAP